MFVHREQLKVTHSAQNRAGSMSPMSKSKDLETKCNPLKSKPGSESGPDFPKDPEIVFSDRGDKPKEAKSKFYQFLSIRTGICPLKWSGSCWLLKCQANKGSTRACFSGGEGSPNKRHPHFEKSKKQCECCLPSRCSL